MSKQSEIEQVKAKANGNWDGMKQIVEKGEQEIFSKGQEALDIVQGQVSEAWRAGSMRAKKASDNAVKLAKAYPFHLAAGGVALGFLLGAKIFARRKS